jgi:Reverse transcriptase (RNA-dependent DNA polymerase)
MARYADDIILGFEHEAEARRFLEAMRERLSKYALTLHPDKTRLRPLCGGPTRARGSGETRDL